jgi:4-hydroxybenzoate polyprenyltransferase
LFALPFAGVGAVLATYEHADRLHVDSLIWIVLAFTSARFAAMGFNRIVDRHWDALNPRTRMRELPTGRLTTAQAAASIVVASLVFIASAWLLNPLCGMLAPVALAWVFFYSYTKRFTHFAHLVLGWGLGIAPVGAYLAIAGAWPTPWFGPVALAAAVMFWVAGFDVMYALQDVEFDRTHGLRSIPARTGTQGALFVARAFHAAAVVLFLLIGVLHWLPAGGLYLLGVGIMAALLLYEHALMRGQTHEQLDILRFDRAFFKVNVGVSTTLFVCTLLDRLLLA